MAPENKIAAFIRRHHVMTLATVGADGAPWCAHAFYAYAAGSEGAKGEAGSEKVKGEAGNERVKANGGTDRDSVYDSEGDSSCDSGCDSCCDGADHGSGCDSEGDSTGCDGTERGFFVFSTDEGTRHGAEMAATPRVAAAIALETRVVGRLQGLQIEGTVHRPEGAEFAAARRTYLRRFPYAAAMPDLALWTLRPTLMKLTDNTLGFGKKLVWTK